MGAATELSETSQDCSQHVKMVLKKNNNKYKRGQGWTNLKKIETGYNCGFLKLGVSLTVFQISFMLFLTFAEECSRLRDSRVRGIEKAQHSASFPLPESLQQATCAIKFGRMFV